MNARTTPPVWFWVLSSVLLLWAFVGLGGFVVDRMMGPAQLAKMSDYDRNFYVARPAWTVWAYGIATASGLLGSVALLARRRVAQQIFVVSLIFVVLMFGYILGATDLIAAKGFSKAAGLPVAIALTGLGEIWLAGHALRKGWIA